MTYETLEKASEIKEKIDNLQYEIIRLPRELLSSTNKKYAERFLKREYRLKILGGVRSGDFDIQLTDEDLKALVSIRENKIKDLQKELEELN